MKGRYSPGGLISRQTVLQLDDSRLIVAIHSHEGVRIPDEGEGEWRAESGTSTRRSLVLYYIG